MVALVIAELTIDHCISTSTRKARNIRFKVTSISIVTATFERIYAVLTAVTQQSHK